MKRLLLLFVLMPLLAPAQSLRWTRDGNGFYAIEKNQIVKYSLPAVESQVLVSSAELSRGGRVMEIENFILSNDESKVLLFTNTKQVWRLETRGDYWVLDLATKKLQQLGKGLPAVHLAPGEALP